MTVNKTGIIAVVYYVNLRDVHVHKSMKKGTSVPLDLASFVEKGIVTGLYIVGKCPQPNPTPFKILWISLYLLHQPSACTCKVFLNEI